eukprot:3998183-Pyramimonas_sp.AAC.1
MECPLLGGGPAQPCWNQACTPSKLVSRPTRCAPHLHIPSFPKSWPRQVAGGKWASSAWLWWPVGKVAPSASVLRPSLLQLGFSCCSNFAVLCWTSVYGVDCGGGDAA